MSLIDDRVDHMATNCFDQQRKLTTQFPHLTKCIENSSRNQKNQFRFRLLNVVLLDLWRPCSLHLTGQHSTSLSALHLEDSDNGI